MIKSNTEIEVNEDILKIFRQKNFNEDYNKLRLLNWIFIRTILPMNSYQYIHTFIDNYHVLQTDIIKNPDSFDIKQKKKILKWFDDIISKNKIENKNNVYKIKIEVDTELMDDYQRGFMNILNHELITKSDYNIIERKIKSSIESCKDKLKYDFDIIEIYPVFNNDVLISIHIFIEEKYLNESTCF